MPSFLGLPIVVASVGATTEALWAELPAGARTDLASMHVAQQDRTEWCWAAVTQALLDHYQQGRQAQCTVAGTFYERNCCAPGDMTNSPELVSDVLHKFGLLAQPVIAGSLDQQRMVDEIDANRPVCLLLTGSSISHVVAVCGYVQSFDNRFCVLLGDPAFGEPVLVAQFDPFTYRGLRPSNTYKTRPPV